MKNRMLSIILIILGVISFLLSLFFMIAHNSTLDGDYELYRMQKRVAMIALIIAIALISTGIISIIIRNR